MKCPLTGKPCIKHKAFHVTEKKDDKINHFIVCEDCLYINEDKKIKMINDDHVCNKCKAKLNEILKGSKIGCVDCYENFKETIETLICHVQKTEDPIHRGAVPNQWRMKIAQETLASTFIEKLEKDMRSAIEQEEYENADKINKILKEFNKVLKKYKKQIKLDEKQEDEKENRAPIVKKELDLIIYNYEINQEH
jgi:protein-arginine kinase activator protein McsA